MPRLYVIFNSTHFNEAREDSAISKMNAIRQCSLSFPSSTLVLMFVGVLCLGVVGREVYQSALELGCLVPK